ncbi:MAG: hypothetical protein RRY97_06735 [Oscillibacter sp.]
MQVMVHYPKEEAAQHELAVRAAQCHADVVIRYIREQPCAREQKIALIDAILNARST